MLNYNPLPLRRQEFARRPGLTPLPPSRRGQEKSDALPRGGCAGWGSGAQDPAAHPVVRPFLPLAQVCAIVGSIVGSKEAAPERGRVPGRPPPHHAGALAPAQEREH